MKINEADWKNEKHVPLIEIEKEGNLLKITVTVGKEIPHPNTFEHHIKWIRLFFLDKEGNTFPIGEASFEGHGEKGFTQPKACFFFESTQKGKIVALAFCNIHGLWKSEKEI